MDKNKYPLLTALMSEGLIYLDKEYGEYVGRVFEIASHTEVVLGTEGSEDLLEAYLQTYNPDMW